MSPSTSPGPLKSVFQIQPGTRSAEKLPETPICKWESEQVLPHKRSINWACPEWTQAECMCATEREGRERGEWIQLFLIIKNATSKVELTQLTMSVWRLKSGLEAWGTLACMTFINLITKILILGRVWERKREKRLHTVAGGLFLFERESSLWKWSSMQDGNSVKMWPTSPPRAHWLAETPRLKIEGGSFADGWCLQTNCRFPLTSLVSLFLTEEDGPLMGLEVILKGLNVNYKAMQASIRRSHYRSSPSPDVKLSQ